MQKASTVAQRVKPPPVTASISYDGRIKSQLLHVSGKAEEVGLSIWDAITHPRNTDGDAGSWFSARPGPSYCGSEPGGKRSLLVPFPLSNFAYETK